MTTKKSDENTETCPAQGLLKLLSGKWKPEIFRLAVSGPLRFNSLLREETIPIQDITVTLKNAPWKVFHFEPGHEPLQVTRSGDDVTLSVPRLELHGMVVASQ